MVLISSNESEIPYIWAKPQKWYFPIVEGNLFYPHVGVCLSQWHQTAGSELVLNINFIRAGDEYSLQKKQVMNIHSKKTQVMNIHSETTGNE